MEAPADKGGPFRLKIKLIQKTKAGPTLGPASLYAVIAFSFTIIQRFSVMRTCQLYEFLYRDS